MQHNTSTQCSTSNDDEDCGKAESPKQPRKLSQSSPSKGTPSSNTVPSQYNSDPFILRFGIDSLYLSYKGELSEAAENNLSKLKELAQSDDLY